MATFRPAPDSIAKCLYRFRQSILDNDFNISTHANERMVQRGISIDDIIDVVKNGQTGVGDVVPDFIGGCFYHRQMFVFVYAPFGDFSARPNIVTVFRDGENYTPDIQDLCAPTQKTVFKTVEKVVKVASEDLSLEELMALVARKQAQKTEAENAARLQAQREREMKRTKLEARLAELRDEMAAVKLELNDLMGTSTQVKKYVNSPALPVGQFEQAWQHGVENDIRSTMGRTIGLINKKELARKFNFEYHQFADWCKTNHPNQ